MAIRYPYYMHEHQLVSYEIRVVMMEYTKDFMVTNKRNKIMLLPYFPT
jgi:hypothetical protein